MRNLVIGFFLGLIFVAVCGYLFLVAGGMPVATQGNPLPLEKFIAKTALEAAIGKDADRPSPIPPNEANLLAGARVYTRDCAGCHGLYHREPTSIAAGMFPKPPQLLPPKKGVTDDPVGETYWKTKNGIRLTGMPAFEKSLKDEELWQVSLMLQQADHLPPSVLSVLEGRR